MLDELVSLYEAEENETIEKEVQKRRTRLGAAGPEQIKREVAREFLGPSQVRTASTHMITLLMRIYAAAATIQRSHQPPQYVR